MLRRFWDMVREPTFPRHPPDCNAERGARELWGIRSRLEPACIRLATRYVRTRAAAAPRGPARDGLGIALSGASTQRRPGAARLAAGGVPEGLVLARRFEAAAG